MKTIKQIKQEYDELFDELLLNPTKENKEKLDAKFKEYLELESKITGIKG